MVAPQGSARAASVRMTLQQWAEMGEDEPGEWVEGVLVEEEMPSYLHEFVIAWFAGALRGWSTSRGAWVAGSGAKFAVSRSRGRMPDLTVYLKGARRPPLEGLIDVPPSIALEVVSPSPRDERRDRIEKLREYAAFGIKWYWMLDPGLRTFDILELTADGRYAHAVAVTEGIVGDVPGCEGLVLDLTALWMEIDAMTENPSP